MSTPQTNYNELPDHLNPHTHIDEIARSLPFERNTITTAHTIINNAPLTATNGKKPRGIAAAALYLAGLQCIDKLSQPTIATAANVGESSIRNHYQALADRE